MAFSAPIHVPSPSQAVDSVNGFSGSAMVGIAVACVIAGIRVAPGIVIISGRFSHRDEYSISPGTVMDTAPLSMAAQLDVARLTPRYYFSRTF
jgi:hypothetical protein